MNIVALLQELTSADYRIELVANEFFEAHITHRETGLQAWHTSMSGIGDAIVGAVDQLSNSDDEIAKSTNTLLLNETTKQLQQAQERIAELEADIDKLVAFAVATRNWESCAGEEQCTETLVTAQQCADAIRPIIEAAREESEG